MKNNYMSFIKNFTLITLLTFVVSCSKKDITVPEPVAVQPAPIEKIDTQSIKLSGGPLLYNQFCLLMG